MRPSTFQHTRLETPTPTRGLESHTAFGLRHIDISLRTISTLGAGFETQGAVSEGRPYFWKYSCRYSLLPLLLSLWVVPLLSFPLPRQKVSSPLRTASVAERPSGAGVAINCQKPRPRRTNSMCREPPCTHVGFVQVLASTYTLPPPSVGV